MPSELSEAVLGSADATEIAAAPLPEATRGLCVRRSDVSMFDGAPSEQVDVRRSLWVEEVELPPLAPDEALVAVMASAVNYNTVWSAMFRPIPTFRFLDAFAAEGPDGARHAIDRHILGSDGAGVVVRVGEEVRHWAVGDEVVVAPLHIDTQVPLAQWDGMLAESQRAWGFETNFGGLAEYAIVKATQLLPKPTHLSWEEAACNTLCLATAYRMLISANGARVKLDDLVLVWGATGGLGGYAVQLARAAGCRTIGIVGSPAKAELARRLGCDLVIDRTKLLDGGDLSAPESWRRLGRAIRERFNADPDHVFEHVGRETFAASVFLAKRGGTVVTCGSSTGYDHSYDNRHLWMRLKRIVGSHGANYEEAAAANRLLDRGLVAPILSAVYPLAEAPEAVHTVHSNRQVGKIGVLCLASEPGLGIGDEERRAALADERLHLFRSFDGLG